MLAPSLALLAAVLQVGPPPDHEADPVLKQPNIMVVIADDFGVDQVGAYGEGNSACTPSLDRFASEGLLFRNAWASPSCAPMRAMFLTGRYGFRTGIGNPSGAMLDVNEMIIPDVLPNHAAACVGKWHLAGRQASHPNDMGFDYYAGGLGGSIGNYYDWQKTVNGSQATAMTYATTDTINEAIAVMQTMPEPWFLVVALNAPHSPYQEPPANLCPGAGCSVSYCSTLPPQPSDLEIGLAMIEAMDTEFGRLMNARDSYAPNSHVTFVGDNGTARALVQAPFDRRRAKGSVYEGGINVPFMVKGPGVPVGETQALVSAVDLLATASELVGSPATTEDSISLIPIFRNPAAEVRQFAYAESFQPNGFGPYTSHDRAVRDSRYKLIRQMGEADEFYDLQADPWEQSNLLPNLTASEQAAYDALVAELVRLGVD